MLPKLTFPSSPRRIYFVLGERKKKNYVFKFISFDYVFRLKKKVSRAHRIRHRRLFDGRRLRFNECSTDRWTDPSIDRGDAAFFIQDAMPHLVINTNREFDAHLIFRK